jgi:hypothetical protein
VPDWIWRPKQVSWKSSSWSEVWCGSRGLGKQKSPEMCKLEEEYGICIESLHGACWQKAVHKCSWMVRVNDLGEAGRGQARG